MASNTDKFIEKVAVKLHPQASAFGSEYQSVFTAERDLSCALQMLRTALESLSWIAVDGPLLTPDLKATMHDLQNSARQAIADIDRVAGLYPN